MKNLSKILKYLALTIGGLILLIALLLGGLTIWLTPQRLTDLFNREASRYLNADIRAKDINYTLWSSFPRFNISTDSILVISRNFKNISPELKQELPVWADTLLEVRSFLGGINIVDIFLNRYVIHDVRINGLNANFVAVNDSLNNYNILPPSNAGFKNIPYISAHLVALKNPGTLRYYSLATNTRAAVNLANLNLKRNPSKMGKNTYHLGLSGKVSLSSAGLTVLRGFPFSLAGNIQLKFKPFGLKLEDYSINLGQLKSSLNMSVGMGNNPGIEHFDYHISTVNLMSLLGYLPKDLLPSVQGIEAYMPVSLTARLLQTWNFSSETFPPISVDFNIPAGELTYTVAPGSYSGQDSPGIAGLSRIPMHYGDISGTFFFNGPNPTESYFRINPFDIRAEDIDINLSAQITRLTQSPLVDVNLNLNSDLKSLPKYIPYNHPIKMTGKLAVNSDIRFNTSGFSIADFRNGLQNIAMAGAIKLNNASLEMPEMDLKMKVTRLEAPTSASIASLTPDKISNPKASVSFLIDSLSGSAGAFNFNARNFTINSDTHIAGNVAPENILSRKPLDVSIKASQLNLNTADNSFGISAIDPSLNLNLTLAGNQKGRNVKAGDNSGNKSGEISGSDRYANPADSLPYPHSPLLISFEVPDQLKSLLTSIDFNTALKVKRLNMRGRGLHNGDCVSNLDLALSNDIFSLNNADIFFEQTRANASGKVSNIRNFILLPAAESNPLLFDLNLALDTVNINALARSYVASKGGVDKIPKHQSTTASDSISLLIPRNIRGNVNVSARETIYTNLHLYNLDMLANIDNGNLHIPHLGIEADFGKAALNLDYLTANPQNMNMAGNLAIQDVNIINFFKNFHALLMMMPEMKNLSGMLSADVGFSGNIFPDMYINMPSVAVDMQLKGWNLRVHQSHFIRKITKMMLIRSDDDIIIRDLDVHAGIHDNLLQLNPLNFEFDRYRLNMEGINNFNGKLYYHIAVDKSPVPFPFSVNIEGMFRKPKLRFGGARYDLRRGEEVTSEIQENNNVNMVKIFKQSLGVFITKAAESPR